MRVHVVLRDDGATEAEETVEVSVHAMGEPEARALRRLGLRIATPDGYHAQARIGDRTVRLRRHNRFALDETRALHLDVYPRPDAVPSIRGACPSCGDALKSRRVGGAYRSIARDERFCASCEAVVLGLSETTDLVGRFIDRQEEQWVTVTTAFRCPACLAPMTKARLQTDDGAADVERCTPCRLLLLEPTDVAQLQGLEQA